MWFGHCIVGSEAPVHGCPLLFGPVPMPGSSRAGWYTPPFRPVLKLGEVVTRLPLAGVPPGRAKHQLGMGRVGGRRTSAILGGRATPRGTRGDPPRAEDAELVLSAPRGDATDYGHTWRLPGELGVVL